ncbi:MAG TPA: divergent polysaccharide deacetylase family protein [Gammaproteobacteria bacterium]|nr:divergent polysaccharide deacetylase family protein [Gammaproteobacteria bacterium]
MKWRIFILSLACLGVVANVRADPAPAASSVTRPVVAIIIDDLGNSLEEAQQVIALPGPIACSILPHTKFSTQIAARAYANRKPVMLHLPMESVSDMPLGPGGITLGMTQKEIQDTVRDDLDSIPHLAGVNNHEGSLITQHPGDMAWIMQVLAQTPGLFYVDSYTSVDSVAYAVAREYGVPAARRNVFLDDIDTEAAVEFQFQRLLKLARKNGFALAIGHPRPATLAVLARELPLLAARGIKLVQVSEIVKLQQMHPLQLPEGVFPDAAYSKSW